MKRTGARPKDGRLLNVQKYSDGKLSPSVFYGSIQLICNFSEADQRSPVQQGKSYRLSLNDEEREKGVREKNDVLGENCCL